MTHFPPAIVHERRRAALRRVGIGLSVLMVSTVLLILGLIIRNERAHDEAECPFAPLGEQTFEGGRVLEEQRSCIDELSERRYLLARDGQKTFELARKRLAKDRFKPGRYDVKLDLDAQKRLVLKIYIDGKLSREFREEDAVRP